MKKILLVCGTGVATSTVARKRVEDILDDNGYKGNYRLTQGKVAEVGGLSPNFDFIVTTVKFDEKTSACPVILATQLLMGFNTESVVEQILEEMKK